MPTIIDLGKKVKTKYPGVYDDLPDAEVGKKVKAKYPGSYDDFTDLAEEKPQQEGMLKSFGKAIIRNPVEVGKSLADTAAYNLPSVFGGARKEIGEAEKSGGEADRLYQQL